jgi:hypothetical protein
MYLNWKHLRFDLPKPPFNRTHPKIPSSGRSAEAPSWVGKWFYENNLIRSGTTSHANGYNSKSGELADVSGRPAAADPSSTSPYDSSSDAAGSGSGADAAAHWDHRTDRNDTTLPREESRLLGKSWALTKSLTLNPHRQLKTASKFPDRRYVSKPKPNSKVNHVSRGTNPISQTDQEHQSALAG